MRKSSAYSLAPWLSCGQLYYRELYILFANRHSLHPFSGLKLKKMIRLWVTMPGLANLFFESYKNMFAF